MNEVTEEDQIGAFGDTKGHILEVTEILGKHKNSENLGNSSAWLPVHYGSENYGKMQMEIVNKCCLSKQVTQRVQPLK